MNDLILMKAAGCHLIAGKKPLRSICWVWFIHFISQNMADIPDLYLSLIKSPQSHFKVCLIKLENCKTPNKERRIIGFPSLDLSLNVSKVLMDSSGLTEAPTRKQYSDYPPVSSPPTNWEWWSWLLLWPCRGNILRRLGVGIPTLITSEMFRIFSSWLFIWWWESMFPVRGADRSRDVLSIPSSFTFLIIQMLGLWLPGAELFGNLNNTNCRNSNQ